MIADVKMAFMQSDHGARAGGRLYATLPPGGVPGYPLGTVIVLMTAVYGLVDGPVVWRETLQLRLLELGDQESSFDPCLFWLPSEASESTSPSSTSRPPIDGVVLADVDHLLQEGHPRHDAMVSELWKRPALGKYSERTG